MITTDYHAVIFKRFLTPYTFVLRLTRENMPFRAGQRIIVGLKGEINQREYSVYSGENDNFLEILVREVEEGEVSLKLKKCEKDDLVNVNGPFGSFGPAELTRNSAKHVFIATGTGISPFHSIIRTYPELDYLLIHGVRYRNEAYDIDEYDPGRHILCTSGEETSGRQERVTGFIANFKINPGMLFYLCGNGRMIYDVTKLLTARGVPSDNIITEIYF